ncbi:MAG TPA: MFS transporter, partial [Methylomirabilota bacterium]|nr:MFS transporter [Methylomirabilota bacterium]
HMWELYAMWTWIGLYLLEAFARAGVTAAPRWGALATALVIAVGGAGCVTAGLLADRLGRTTTTILAMLGSGTCAAVVGVVFDRPAVLVAVTLVWGFTVIADSAQFSAAVSELAPAEYVGTALSLQTGIGFLLTLASIRLVPEVAEAWGWASAFAVLAPGPFLGTVAMWALRHHPESRRLAQGRR